MDRRGRTGLVARDQAETSVSYLRGLGVLEEGGTWSLRSGVAVPLVPAMLSYFESIQRVVNAINAKEKRPLIPVDGRIGPVTADAVSVISVKHGTDPWINTKITPTFIAQNAPDVVGELLPLMQRLGAIYVPDPRTSSKPSTLKQDGTIDNPPDAGFQLSPVAMVIAAASVGVVIALGTKKKGRRK